MPTPTEINLKQSTNELTVQFDTGETYLFTCEYLRVFSPSAEVRGHGPGQEVLQLGKRDVGITDIEPVGSYAVKLSFTDGHNTGLYSWGYLYELGTQQSSNWQGYLARMATAGASRDPGTLPLKGPETEKQHACGGNKS